MALIDEIKLSMRISHDALDSDISSNIAACQMDMQRVGITSFGTSTSTLTGKACELYCKAQYNFLGKSEQYQNNYEKLRDAISLIGEE